MKRINEIQERWEKATKGPWFAKHRPILAPENDPDIIAKRRSGLGGEPGSSVHNGDPGNSLWGSLWPNRNGSANAEAIAHAPADIAALTAAVQGVLALCDESDSKEVPLRKILHTQSIRAAIDTALEGTP